MTLLEIGSYVKEQRELNNLTQKELADKIGMRRQTIIDIEQAQVNYGIVGLLAILEVLGTPLSFISGFSFKNVQPYGKEEQN